MNNQDKAIGIAKSNAHDYVESHYEFGDLQEYYVTSYEECKQSALEMAEWKDQQFKEYLEKKRDSMRLFPTEYDMCQEIINELFKEENK